MNESVYRTAISNDWLTLLFVACLGLVVCAKLLFETRFSYFKSLFASDKYLLIYGKEKRLVFNWFNMLLFATQIISYTLIIYLAFDSFLPAFANTKFLFLKVFSFLLLGISFKYFLEKIIASTFEIDQLIEQYNFQKLSYRNLISLYLLPLTVIVIFANFDTTVILYVVIVLFLLVNLIVSLIIFRNYQKTIIDNLFYFILYLCALEIAPYLIVYKVMQLNGV